MKVTLISYTGHGNPDLDYAARLLVYTKNTRLEQGEETRRKVSLMTTAELNSELLYVANTIRSSWEFIDYIFEIRDVTRAFTHQLVRTRTGSYAQQSQRSVDMESFTAEMPKSLEGEGKDRMRAHWKYCMDAITETYRYLSRHGISAQDCRGVLPTNVHTNIIAKFNLRTVADLIGKRESLRAQGEYATVARAIASEVMCVHPWTKEFLYPERTVTPVLDGLLKELLGDQSPVDAPRINLALKELDKVKGTWG